MRRKQDKEEEGNSENTSVENRDKGEGNKMKMEKKLKEEGIKWGQKQDKTEEKGEK